MIVFERDFYENFLYCYFFFVVISGDMQMVSINDLNGQHISLLCVCIQVYCNSDIYVSKDNGAYICVCSVHEYIPLASE